MSLSNLIKRSFLLIATNVCINLNTSDSGLHHTISLMYVGVRQIGFGIS